jgi:folate-binding protein YgfZ
MMIIGGMTDLTLDAAQSPPLATAPHGAVRLSDWGLIRARGADARAFLQGQLTGDLVALSPGWHSLAGYCSAKGRLMASFVVWSSGPQDWWLACSADLLPATLKRLSMFVLRAKCQLSDATPEFGLWGLAGDSARAALGDLAAGTPGTVRIDGEQQALRLVDVDSTPRWLLARPTGAPDMILPPLDPAAWRWMEVASGVARIVAATADQFVPQMVNFELVGGVSFQKGCYPGQEVVARSQYRGTLKRRATLLASTEPLIEGQEVFHESDPGQPAGLVALAASLDARGHLGLVEIKRALLEMPGSFRLGAADGPKLAPRALPYTVPVDNE